jgi:hypothetical protein
MRKVTAIFATVVFASVLASVVEAQAAGMRTAELRVGGLMYDRGGDATNPLLGAGVNWMLSRHILAEVEGNWSSSDGFYLDYVGNPSNPQTRETSTHLAIATAGVQAQALLGPVRPYIGIAGGLFVRYDEQPGGDRFLSRTMAFPVGLRIDITDRIGLRGELRARFDTHQDGGSGTNLEQTAGLTFRF